MVIKKKIKTDIKRRNLSSLLMLLWFLPLSAQIIEPRNIFESAKIQADSMYASTSFHDNGNYVSLDSISDFHWNRESKGLKCANIPSFSTMWGVQSAHNQQVKLQQHHSFNWDYHLQYKDWLKLHVFFENDGLYNDYLNDAFLYSDNELNLTGLGLGWKDKDWRFFLNFGGSLQLKAGQFFTFSGGQERNFFGQGKQSLFLGNYLSPQPYFKIKTKFWNIEYTNLYLFLNDTKLATGVYQNYREKYIAAHHLSWNVTKWANLELFESIVWQGADTLYSRNFDVYYLNPIIFYRPVEYSIGSGDNALLGMALNFKLYKGLKFYSQLMLDEFNLTELRKADGWWANKFSMQFGLKYANAFDQEGLFLRLEYNMVRPFTFTHGDPYQAYTGMGQALGHSQGANFQEVMAEVVLDKKPIKMNFYYLARIKGFDNDTAALGANVFRSYNDRVKENGHRMAQGETHVIHAIGGQLFYEVLPKYNMGVMVQPYLAMDYINNQAKFMGMLMLGWQWNPRFKDRSFL